MKSLFEEMGGTYRQVGDYFIPNLVLPDDGNYQIGKYGRMRRIYLKEHRKILYTNYVMEGTLFKHLSEIDQACNERIENIVSTMAKQEGVTEALKAADQMEWVRRMNSIRNRGPGRKFCVSDFRQSQEFLVENTHYLAYFPCPPSPQRGAAVCAPGRREYRHSPPGNTSQRELDSLPVGEHNLQLADHQIPVLSPGMPVFHDAL